MKVNSKIRSVETLAADAGFRNYYFVKITTEDGIVGWSEYDEGFGAPASAPPSRSSRLASSASRSAITSGSTRSSIRSRGRPPAASLPWRWAPSRTRFSTPRPRRWASPATSF